jgi:hypothetical protein
MQNEDREQQQRDEQESVRPGGDQPDAGSSVVTSESDDGDGGDGSSDSDANPPIIISG